MPLHLLVKKSWNVYNQVNIDRVRQDEAAAQAEEDAKEVRMQQEDAARRMAILRGERQLSPDVPLAKPLTDAEQAALELSRTSDKDSLSHGHRERKRKRFRGEDDTDRDIRYARQDAEASARRAEIVDQPRLSGKPSDAPVEDERGHIQLFSEPTARKAKAGKPDRQAPTLGGGQKPNGRTDPSVVSDFQSARKKPWYASQSATSIAPTVSEKDVWGNDDPRRKEREQNRIVSSDPFAVMQRAQTQLKASERDREAWQKARQRELEDLKKMDGRRKRHKRRHLEEGNGLEEWDLNGKTDELSRDRDRDRQSERSRSSRHRHQDDSKTDREHRHRPHHRHRHRS
ncbi:hypothetical protein K431DRAFT_319713 [Polychaeton citri CBS 116435]|uniref:CBF1-interacting co-repressor CIR N-terminal domain-containing protein n=1 Tax=Polychaeton citri CBS 116435 TaxID=1314669 RepID=A0A9P4Q9I5_9PEZI|nr:hypothetical protein K431DRAFT_319713 [Polychaeton citri CBS 116435]